MPRNDFINTDGTINYDNIASTSQNFINVKYPPSSLTGAKGDGVIDDYTTLNNIITSIGSNNSQIYLPSGTYIIGTNLTIPSNISLIFANGAMLSPNTSITITINGYINSPMSQIFGGSGTIAGTFKNKEVYPQWFGAKGDGINDDKVAIQNAVNIGAGKNSIIIGQSGDTFIISNEITVPSNSHLIIGGIIKLKNGSNINLFYINGVSNILIEGSGTIDGNRVNQTISVGCGIYLNNCSEVTIKGLIITQTKLWGVNVVGSHEVLLEGIEASYNGASNEFAAGSYNCWAIGCRFHHVDDECFAFYGGVYNSGMVGCECYNSTAAGGISLLNDSAQPTVCHDISIINNICYSNFGNGIESNSGVGGNGNNYATIIQGNVCHHNDQSNQNGGGIRIGAGQAINISGNICHHDGNGNAETDGIGIWGNSCYIVVSNNTIYDEGQGNTNGMGITIGGSATVHDILIEGNMIYDDQGTKTLANCLVGSVGSNVVVRNNHLGACISTANNLTAGTKSVFEGNFGYNPVGHITSPAIPASTVVYTNSNPYTCRVFVYGGTVTVIAISGTTTGIISGEIMLAPGDTITLTYSVAPSWAWFGL